MRLSYTRRQLDRRARRLNRLRIQSLHAVGLRLHIERRGVGLFALRDDVQLTDGVVGTANVQKHPRKRHARFLIIRVDLNSFAERRLGFLFIEQRVVNAAQIQRGLAVLWFKLQSLFEMLRGSPIIVRSPLVVLLQSVMDFVQRGLISPPRDRNLKRNSRFTPRNHQLLARAVRLVPELHTLHRMISRTQSRQP